MSTADQAGAAMRGVTSAALPVQHSPGAVPTGAVPTAAVGTGAVPTAVVPTGAVETAAVGTGAVETAAVATTPARPSAPSRRVRLTVARVDPWSAMKMSFLLSVALGVAMVVAVSVLWAIMKGMGVFEGINGIVGQVVQDGAQKFDILDFVGYPRVLSLSIVIAVVDVILITAIATLAAFLYNVSSALVGGLQLTLTDD